MDRIDGTDEGQTCEEFEREGKRRPLRKVSMWDRLLKLASGSKLGRVALLLFLLEDPCRKLANNMQFRKETTFG